MTVKPTSSAPVERYGYYLAHTGTEHGDPIISEGCADRWADLGVETPLPFDGVSAWVDSDGTQHIRIFCRDFFSATPKVAQAMVTR